MKIERLLILLSLLIGSLNLYSQSVSIEQVWIDHNVYHNNQKGMKIHCKFHVYNFKNKNCHLCLMHYIEHADGRELWGNTQYYTTTDRHGNPQATAICGFDINPEWDDTVYYDWYVFMPYSALHINSGKFDLRVASLAWNKTADYWCADRVVYTPFTYTVNNSPKNSVTPAQQNVIVTPIYPAPAQQQSCGVCGGTGHCSICGGTGKSPNHAPGINASCGGCGGTGKCATCRGMGVL